MKTIKNNFTTTVKLLLADRIMLGLVVGLIVTALLYALYVGFSLQSSDLQVATRYTAYGETNFYRNKWYYLFSFVALGVIIAVVHIALVIKLYIMERRHLAIAFASLSFLVLFIAFMMTRSVLGIAFL